MGLTRGRFRVGGVQFDGWDEGVAGQFPVRVTEATLVDLVARLDGVSLDVVSCGDGPTSYAVRYGHPADSRWAGPQRDRAPDEEGCPSEVIHWEGADVRVYALPDWMIGVRDEE